MSNYPPSSDPFNHGDYKPPYQPAEAVFNFGTVPMEFKERAFLVLTPQGPASSFGYWKRNQDSGMGNGYVTDRNEGDLFCWNKVVLWPSDSQRIELLPLPKPATITASDRDIKFGELGKVESNRLCILKNKEGQYVDGNLQPVADRMAATIQRVDKLYAMDIVKPFTFELLVPADADTGGPEMKETVKFAEAQRDTDAARFLVKYVEADAVTGYSYFSAIGSRSNRAKAWVMDKKNLRRYFEDVKKELIFIELLKPMPLSKITDFFSADAIQLIKLAFKSDNIRGFMLSKLKVMPPKELDTFEKLQEWIEWNVGKVSRSGTTEIALDAMATPAAPQTMEDVELAIPMTRSRTARGTCRFWRQESGQETLGLQLSELRDMAEESQSWNNFRRLILDELYNADDNVDYEEISESGTSEHATDDTDDQELKWDGGQVTADATIKAFMRQHLPEHLTRLERGT